MNQFKKLTDESIMPWGKYRDQELQDVPANYLIWLEGEMLKKPPSPDDSFRNGLLVYISDNRDVIEMQAKKYR